MSTRPPNYDGPIITSDDTPNEPTNMTPLSMPVRKKWDDFVSNRHHANATAAAAATAAVASSSATADALALGAPAQLLSAIDAFAVPTNYIKSVEGETIAFMMMDMAAMQVARSVRFSRNQLSICAELQVAGGFNETTIVSDAAAAFQFLTTRTSACLCSGVGETDLADEAKPGE